MAYGFQVDNRNKKSVVLDLKTPAAYEALCRIIREADVLITNYRLKALDKLLELYLSIKIKVEVPESHPIIFEFLLKSHMDLSQKLLDLTIVFQQFGFQVI